MSRVSPDMETIVLSWLGPFPLRPNTDNSVWVCPPSGESGMYLWAVPASGGFLVHRLRETALPFWHRQFEDLMDLQQGASPIYHAGSLARGVLTPIHRGARDRNAHLWWRPEFHNKRRKLEAETRAAVGLLEVFLAPLPVSVRIRRRIEQALTRRLRAAGRTVSAVLEHCSAHGSRVPPAEAPIRVRSVSGAGVAGLVGEFEA